MSGTHRSDRDRAVAAVAMLREVLTYVGTRPSINYLIGQHGGPSKLESWQRAAEALHEELGEPPMVVEFCAWCPEPKAPRREFHPDGTGRHVEVRRDGT